MNDVLLGEPLDKIIFVGVDTFHEVTRESDIKSTIALTCKNVDIVIVHVISGFRFAKGWNFLGVLYIITIPAGAGIQEYFIPLVF